MDNPRVLIADDDEMNLIMLEMILTDEGVNRIDKACNGRDALEMFEDSLCENPYVAVFLDISMPIMDGLEALKNIRAIEDEADYRTTIIMATGDNSSETVAKSLVELDADEYVAKPYSRAEIHEALARHGVVA